MTTVLVGSWQDGLFVWTANKSAHELPGQPVRALAGDGSMGVVAVVGRSLKRRNAQGDWSTVADTELDLSCCAATDEAVYVGTDDARVLRVGWDGSAEVLPGFDDVPGRQTWYAGQALVGGQMLGPPLGVRSISVAYNGSILANVHVGGIPRSTDGGQTWAPTIDVDADVHEVRVHPTRSEIVVAAAAVGFCVSRDGGVTWQIEQDGLHADYCSAVAFCGDDVLVAASAGHFATEGAIYRRSLQTAGSLTKVGGGLPTWLGGIADTRCIAVKGLDAAVVDQAGSLYTSSDGGRSWSRAAEGLSSPSCVLIA